MRGPYVPRSRWLASL